MAELLPFALILLLLLLPSFVIPLLSLFIFGILGSTDTSTHIGFVGAFLDWECDEAIPLLLELESMVRWMDDEGQGTLSPLVPL